jgi:hypothetical protein
MMRISFVVLAVLPTVLTAETIWLEAEHFDGIRGFCWPQGKPEMRKTDGHWGLSGPGWAAEWIQGGESGFLSIASGADDDKAVASTTVDIPVAGNYRIWVRFRENRGTTNRFNVQIGPKGGVPTVLTYGQKPNIDEDNEMKLYWNWAFAWEAHEVELKAGPATITLSSAFKEKECRQIDCLVLTTDQTYRAYIKERPVHPTRTLLEEIRRDRSQKLEPLARRAVDIKTPSSWTPRTFRDRGFLYLWNMNAQVKWAGADPKRVPVPYNVADEETRKAFESLYAGKKDVPIFGDPRIVPVFHGSGPYILEPDKKDGTPNPEGRAFIKWLDDNPERNWGLLLNYHPDNPVSAAGRANFLKYRERFVGSVAGESLGYFYVKPEAMKAATASAKTRRELAEAITKASLAENAVKYKTVYGQDWPDAYREVIPCQSIMMTAFAPLCYSWGARTVGYESSAITSGMLAMRMAFLRGAARQNEGMTTTYRSCNFGDSSTIFSEQSSFTKPRNILDNYYSVYSGAGMSWYKFDVWHQYMAGASMFYHEQGFDEFWMPGGTTAAGLHPVQLSPKGKIVDRFLTVTRKHADRGVPFTPVAFLVDYAHGWDPAPFAPHAFDDYGKRPDLTKYGDHERMLQEYFWTAYHPIGIKGESPTTGTSEVNVPGVFGDIFDVIYAYPDVKKWTTIDTYPVVIAAGHVELTAAEGKRLAKYVDDGGTLLVADGQLSGPGVAALALPKGGAIAEAIDYKWLPANVDDKSQRFRYRPLAGGQALATTPDGKCFCAAYDRGKGRLIVLSVPQGLGIDKSAHPVVARLMAHLTSGQTPVRVDGDVEWMLNRTATGWIVTLFNPAGQDKPQQGITPTDYRQNRTVTIRTTRPIAAATDWLAPGDAMIVKDGELKLTVLAGSVRVVELTEK